MKTLDTNTPPKVITPECDSPGSMDYYTEYHKILAERDILALKVKELTKYKALYKVTSDTIGVFDQTLSLLTSSLSLLREE